MHQIMKKPGKRKTLFAVLCVLLLVQSNVSVVFAGGPSTNRQPPMTPGLAERLKHLTLDDAIDIAVHRNPDILRQLQEIQRNQGLVIQVRAALLPHLIMTGTFQQTDKKLLESGTGTTGAGGTTAGGTGTPTTGGTTGTGTGTTTNTQVFVPTTDSTGTVQTGVLNLSSLLSGSNVQEAQRNYNITIEVQQTLYNAALLPQYRQARFTRDAAYYQLREIVDTTVNTVKNPVLHRVARRGADQDSGGNHPPA